MKRWRWLAVSVIVSVLTGCSLGALTRREKSDQLRYYGFDHQICIPSKKPTGALGWDVFVNKGPGDVRVDKVTWKNPSGLKNIEIRAVARGHDDLYFSFGMAYGDPGQWAGRHGKDRTGRWQQRVWRRGKPVEGFKIPVTRKGDTNWTTFVITYEGTRGHAGPLRVEYTDRQGRTGVVTSDVRLEVRPVC